MSALARAFAWKAKPENRSESNGKDWYVLEIMLGSPERVERLLVDSAGFAVAKAKPKVDVYGKEVTT